MYIIKFISFSSLALLMVKCLGVLCCVMILCSSHLVVLHLLLQFCECAP